MADNRKISVNKNGRVVRKGNLFLLKGFKGMKYDKKQAVNIIVKAARDYQNSLQDKYFLIIYQNGNKIESVQVGF